MLFIIALVVALVFPVNNDAIDTVDAVVIPASHVIMGGIIVPLYDETVFDCAVGSMLIDGHYHHDCVVIVYGVEAAEVAEAELGSREAQQENAHLVR